MSECGYKISMKGKYWYCNQKGEESSKKDSLVKSFTEKEDLK